MPTPAPAVPSVTALQDTNIRTGPGTEYNVIGKLKKNQQAEAIGRNSDGLWWVLKVPAAPGGQGWVSAELVSAENTDNLPVIQAPPPPTATPEGQPQPPKAVIEGTTQTEVGQTVSFTARNSQVAEGSHINTFDWDFDDSAAATGVDVSHVYNDSGTYKVSLTVTDDKGLSDTTIHQIKIEAGPEAPEPTEEPPEPTEEPPAGSDLEGIEWVLDDTLPDTEMTALFQDGTLSGSSGCNTYSATYQINGNNLVISSPVATEMACAEEIMTQESEYLANLMAAQSYRVKGDQLKITGSGQALNYTER